MKWNSKGTCDGVLTATAFLRHSVFVAFHTEDLVLVVGETGPRQRLWTRAAHKTVAVPRLVLVVHASGGDGLHTDTGWIFYNVHTNENNSRTSTSSSLAAVLALLHVCPDNIGFWSRTSLQDRMRIGGQLFKGNSIGSNFENGSFIKERRNLKLN